MLQWIRNLLRSNKVARKYWFEVTITLPIPNSILSITASTYVIDTSGNAAYIQLQRKLRYACKNATFKSSTVKKIEPVKAND